MATSSPNDPPSRVFYPTSSHLDCQLQTGLIALTCPYILLVEGACPNIPCVEAVKIWSLLVAVAHPVRMLGMGVELLELRKAKELYHTYL